jgi:predicted nucleic acid-binding protein
MANEVFWDTSGFYALLSRDDPNHLAASDLGRRQLEEGSGSVTTEYVVAECCTLLVARRKSHLIDAFLGFTEAESSLSVIRSDSELFEATKAYLRRHVEHGYSFVDCMSFVVMERFSLLEAATTDAHFRAARFIPLLV